ncbi:hypothetical protein FOA52_011017 [Chlamydomonas sp. UWO 241]|nr:hypothetical protein FOA52_011017 [Chlamydomonas sp. UWO 241]
MTSLGGELAFMREQRKNSERDNNEREEQARASGERTESRRHAAAAAAMAAAARSEVDALTDHQRRMNLLAALPTPPMPPTYGLPPLSNTDTRQSAAESAARMAAAGMLAALRGGAGPGGEDERRAPLTIYKKRSADSASNTLFEPGGGYVPGWMVGPPGGTDVGVQNLPAKSGIGLRLHPARLSPASCVPPPQPEMTDPPVTIGPQMAQLDSLRTMYPERVANTLVFDSLEPPKPAPPKPGAGDAAAEEGFGGGGWGGGGGAGGSGDGTGTGAGGDATASTTGGEDGVRGGGDAGARSAKGRKPPRAVGPASRRSMGGGGGGGGGGEEVADEASSRHNYLPELACWYRPQGDDDTTLVFESRFESGNLRRAHQVYPCGNEYDLILHPDINTRGHTQWFYFAVSNTRKGMRYKFNIINLMKDDSLYNDGMLPLVHSSMTLQCEGLGWHRSCEKIAYYRNNVPRGKGSKRYYTLTFTYVCTHDGDVVHFAHCYPYTYTDLMRYLAVKLEQPHCKGWVKREALCSSLAGNVVDVLTITSPGSAEAVRRRRGVIISSRVHPGESNASWMMKTHAPPPASRASH